MLMEEIDYAQYMLCSRVINPCNPHLEVLNPLREVTILCIGVKIGKRLNESKNCEPNHWYRSGCGFRHGNKQLSCKNLHGG